MANEISVAVHFVDCILNNNGNASSEAFLDLLEIQSGNKEILLNHLKAINSITTIAIENLEKSGTNE